MERKVGLAVMNEKPLQEMLRAQSLEAAVSRGAGVVA
jgi:hypothetical protein